MASNPDHPPTQPPAPMSEERLVDIEQRQDACEELGRTRSAKLKPWLIDRRDLLTEVRRLQAVLTKRDGMEKLREENSNIVEEYQRLIGDTVPRLHDMVTKYAAMSKELTAVRAAHCSDYRNGIDK